MVREIGFTVKQKKEFRKNIHKLIASGGGGIQKDSVFLINTADDPICKIPELKAAAVVKINKSPRI